MGVASFISAMTVSGSKVLDAIACSMLGLLLVKLNQGNVYKPGKRRVRMKVRETV